jgi:hypothetical protein
MTVETFIGTFPIIEAVCDERMLIKFGAVEYFLLTGFSTSAAESII